MSINTNPIASNVYAQSYVTSSKATTKTTKQGEVESVKKEEKVKESQNLGKIIGEPTLSKEAQKYYEKLKNKYGNYDFILVSEDQKANVQANAGKYANNIKTVVLIDEDKIERMATDENYRKKYEGILSGASTQLGQLKSSMEKYGANVKGYGMQVNDGGTASFFAVLKKASSDQKARMEKTAEKKKAEKKAEEKKAEKKQAEARLEKSKAAKASKADKVDNTDSFDDEETIIITADSIDELMKKISDYTFIERSNNVQTEGEKLVGQHVDFRR